MSTRVPIPMYIFATLRVKKSKFPGIRLKIMPVAYIPYRALKGINGQYCLQDRLPERPSRHYSRKFWASSPVSISTSPRGKSTVARSAACCFNNFLAPSVPDSSSSFVK